ncbi:MAG: ThiF family adenylyltransferase [Deltaproteobacteria bacterium]|nr:MAG: ThiF family adenylyltransferase [Deltaproteobacteria bacterium]
MDRAKIGIVGDDDLLTSLYVMSASALGINDVVAVAPVLDESLIATAKKVNTRLSITHMVGFYTHPVMDDIFIGCDLIVDLSQYGLANKLLLEKGFREGLPIIRGFCYENDDEQGFRVFTYVRGREWQELEQIVSPNNLPRRHFDDGVLDIIVSGIALEETKNILMGQELSEDMISYERKKLGAITGEPNILVTGSGALGVFVGLGLAYAGLQNTTFMDPDITDLTNLNRQVFLYEAVGTSKAGTLSRRLNRLFGTNTNAEVAYFTKNTDITTFNTIFDCVDNFETRIVMSEKCKDQKKILISGGTNVDAGQVVIYDPKKDDNTPAELLGLYDIVDQRQVDAQPRDRASCTYHPDPSVIMTNQIVAGLMVDSYRMLLDGQEPINIFYNSTSNGRI